MNLNALKGAAVIAGVAMVFAAASARTPVTAAVPDRAGAGIGRCR